MIKGFRDFILRGNVIELAVAVIIGAAFGGIVTAIAEGLITPLIALFMNVDGLEGLNTGAFKWGTILAAIVNFLITAFVVYFFVVVPMNRLMERFKPSEPAPQKTRPCPECLSDIPISARRCAFCTADVTPQAALGA
ncbi:MAG: large conductance mechanosensitive channel protein MscL [Chloroflexi bacterium]|nr:large conductance mechanosensitive channel protein MscL [Chloroflexota bacterium]